jgi:hypothetical protein
MFSSIDSCKQAAAKRSHRNVDVIGTSQNITEISDGTFRAFSEDLGHFHFALSMNEGNDNKSDIFMK